MAGRTLPLFDPTIQPSTWAERMSPGEFAVHSSSAHTCDVFSSLAEAESSAQARILTDPTLRLRIFSHEGFVGEPLRDLRGSQFRGELDFSPRTRRWLGGSLLIIGIALVIFDWFNNFKYSWPALIGSRLLIPGILLVFIEWMIVLTAKQKQRRAAAALKHSSENH